MQSGASLSFASAPESAEPSALGELFVAIRALTHEPAVRPEDAADAGVLRRAIAACANAAARDIALPDDAVATINSFAGDDPPVPLLRTDRSCLRGAAAPVRAALAAIARDAIETLATGRDRLRTCEGCGGVFEDRSRAGKRRWCSMTACGNRAKVAAFRKRRNLSGGGRA